jgi:uncharacterized protein YdbL (DUF1318 family)
MHSVLFRLLFLIVTAGFGAAVVRAEDLNAVKARMEHRQSTVDTLKDRQAVGENNRGFLEARGTLSGEDERVMMDENSDRRTVYAALAAQTSSTPDQVGRQRAQQLALRSKRGVWVQDPSGEWRQKG